MGVRGVLRGVGGDVEAVPVNSTCWLKPCAAARLVEVKDGVVDEDSSYMRLAQMAPPSLLASLYRNSLSSISSRTGPKSPSV